MTVRTEPSAPPSPEGELAAQWIGRVIDERYRIVEVLGEGGMGAVFVAEHLKLRKLVALKTIRTEFAGDGQAEARFSREALATAQIDHPHVVSAMDYGHLPDGGAYLVIQLVRGETLASRLERGAMHWRQAADLAAQIADALATCHAVGIIHRDLKPDNILLEQRDDGSLHARVVDFGIARLSGDAGDGVIVDATAPITRMGAIIGTPGYMAPEQAVGQSIDHRVDIYALGVILWECSTGKRLWHGDSLTALFARQLAGAAPTLHDMLAGQAPEALSEVTAQLIAPAPEQRPSSAATIRDDLRRLAFGGDASVHTSSPQISMVGSQPGGAWSPLGPATPAGLPTRSAEFSTPGGTLITGPPGPAPLGLRMRVLALQWPRLARYGAAAAALLVLVLVYQCGRHSEPDADSMEVVADTADEAKSGKAKGKGKGKTEAPATKSKVAELGPAPTLAPSPAEIAEVPEAFAEHAAALLTGTNSKARKRAADAIAGASEAEKETIPEYLRNLAWLEKISGCEDKRPVLQKIEESGDLRALPGLQTIANMKKKTCGGFFNSRDCLGCLRVDLGRVIGRFESQ